MNVRILKEVNIFLILFFVLTLFTFLLLNGGAIFRNLRYDLFLHSPFASADLKQGDLLAVPAATSTPNEAPAPATPGADRYKLTIPKIELASPVVIPEKASKESILASLEEGVGLYPGSRLPGENGRAVILGHSSRATWYRGDYATVFALLGKLEAGDEFYITEANKKYVYQVFSRKILTPADTNTLLAGPAAGSEVDLVTCYPIGGASKRTVVQAILLRTEGI